MNGLPAPYSTALRMHFVQGLSIDQVAGSVGLLPRDTARLLLDGAAMLQATLAGRPASQPSFDPNSTLGVQREDPAAEELVQLLRGVSSATPQARGVTEPSGNTDEQLAPSVPWMRAVLEARAGLPVTVQQELQAYFEVLAALQPPSDAVAPTLVGSPPRSSPQPPQQLPYEEPLNDALAPTLVAPAGATKPTSPADEVTLPVSPGQPGAAPPPGAGPSPQPAVTRGPARSSASTGTPIAEFGDYEILSTIARGGMGIVYKARQKKLNRIVAVKMILSGQFAGKEEIERFFVEAEAAAKLRHPNIVAVHEIGEWQGQHYFSMDFIDGKSLADLVREQPLPPRRAAEFVSKIADTVQFAHEQGILHRDLKPSNVLVDNRGEPYITDFGLAKQLSDQSQLTVSGTVVGTPSYMPPEQASGHIEQVGPHSDIYSLGAILYELLTGRPPFRAATPFETIRQVLQDEPVSPRLINTSVPKDLETICLKCLQKEPARRYSSAGELAAELRCFLEGKPIKARPVGAIERTWRWCRRNPWLASAFATAAVFLVIAFVGLATAFVYRGWALRESEASFREALRVINNFTTRVSEETLLNQPGMQPLRRDLLELALDHYQSMLQRRSNDPALQDELAGTYFRIGVITSLLKSPSEAIPFYEQAVAMQQRLLERSPKQVTRIAALANTLNALATARVALGELAAAKDGFEKSLSLRRQLCELDAQEIEYQRLLANAHMNVGLVLDELGQLAEAQREIETAQDIRRKALEKALEKSSDDGRLRRDLAKGYYSLGWLQLRSELLEESQRSFLAAAEQLESVLKRFPNDLENQKLLTTCYRLLGQQASSSNPAQARLWYAKAVDRIRPLAAANPDVVDYKLEYAGLLLNIGDLEMNDGNLQAASDALGLAQEMLTPLVQQNPRVVQPRRDLATVLRLIGELRLRQDQKQEAQKYLRQSAEILEGLAREFPQDEDILVQWEAAKQALAAIPQ